MKLIKCFSEWFDNKINFVSTINDKDIGILVCCSLIDALAKCVYCDKPNKERFINILELFGNTSIWTRVSLYHLEDENRQLIENNTAANDYCCKKLNWTANGSKIDYDVDPTICEMHRECVDFASNKLKKLCNKYKYSTIFYEKYRCGLVHEARVAAEFSFDYWNGDAPYYASHSDADNKGSTETHLIIPQKFIITSTQVINNNVKEWLIKQNINPYERYGLI